MIMPEKRGEGEGGVDYADDPPCAPPPLGKSPPNCSILRCDGGT